MSYFGVGDLAVSLISRRSNGNLKGELLKVNQELSSGRVADVSSATGGNLTPLASIERALSLAEGYTQATSLARTKLSHQETALNVLQTAIEQSGPDLLVAVNTGAPALEAALSKVSGNFETVVSALSTEVGGTYVFSGNSTTVAPLSSAADILQTLSGVVDGATTATDYIQRIENWFSDPGGFQSSSYQGGEASPSGVPIGPKSQITVSTTASDPEIVETLKDLATLALASRYEFSGSAEELISIVRITAESTLNTASDLINVSARVGAAQERIEQVTSQNSASIFSLQESRNKILEVDPFRSATRLEALTYQLESLYLVTSKTAQLKLTEYLR